jgi:RNA polymerase sigma-70 factor (ECF subfamily)
VVPSVSQPHEPPDDQLVEQALAGSVSALNQLLSRHYSRVRAVCCRIAGDTRDGEDAAQEALIKIVRNLRSFDQRSSFSTWIYRIATNSALDELRKRQRQPIAVAPTTGGSESPQAPGLVEQVDPLTSQEMDRVTDRMVIQEAISALSEDHRKIVVLRDIAELEYAEIADVLEIPEGTVKSRLARARRELTLRIRNYEGS